MVTCIYILLRAHVLIVRAIIISLSCVRTADISKHKATTREVHGHLLAKVEPQLGGLHKRFGPCLEATLEDDNGLAVQRLARLLTTGSRRIHETNDGAGCYMIVTFTGPLTIGINVKHVASSRSHCSPSYADHVF